MLSRTPDPGTVIDTTGAHDADVKRNHFASCGGQRSGADVGDPLETEGVAQTLYDGLTQHTQLVPAFDAGQNLVDVRQPLQVGPGIKNGDFEAVGWQLLRCMKAGKAAAHDAHPMARLAVTPEQSHVFPNVQPRHVCDRSGDALPAILGPDRPPHHPKPTQGRVEWGDYTGSNRPDGNSCVL